MLLKILKGTHPILKTKAEPIPEVTAEIKLLAAQMLATMKVAKGVGMAAPQIGRSIQMIVFDTGEEFGILINPELIQHTVMDIPQMEGCLSFPRKFCMIARYEGVEIKYVDLSGNTVVKKFKGLTARIIQHEMDHLVGITMYDRRNENADT